MDARQALGQKSHPRYSRDRRESHSFRRASQSHAASAFFCSPFDDAAILTVDGVGEWATATSGQGHGTSLRLDSEIRFPHSLGLLYSALTAFLGFAVNEGEYKVMGMAASACRGTRTKCGSLWRSEMTARLGWIWTPSRFTSQPNAPTRPGSRICSAHPVVPRHRSSPTVQDTHRISDQGLQTTPRSPPTISTTPTSPQASRSSPGSYLRSAVSSSRCCSSRAPCGSQASDIH